MSIGIVPWRLTLLDTQRSWPSTCRSIEVLRSMRTRSVSSIESPTLPHFLLVDLQIIQDDEVYRLVKRFKDHEDNLFKQNKEKNRHLAVFPCRLRILPRCVFAGRNPIICGVKVEDGFVKIGTPICVPSKGVRSFDKRSERGRNKLRFDRFQRIELGRITSIQLNHKPIEIAQKGAEVSIRIESATGDSSKIFGRHFDENDELVSKVSSRSTLSSPLNHTLVIQCRSLASQYTH